MEDLVDHIQSLRGQGLGLGRLAAKTHSQMKPSAIQRLLADKNPTFRTLESLQPAMGVDMHTFAHLVFDVPLPRQLGEVDGTTKDILEALKQADEKQAQEVLDFAQFIVSKNQPKPSKGGRKKGTAPTGSIRGKQELIPGRK